MTSPPIYKTIPEQIEQHLRNEILSGILKAGQPLREHELSKRFGVSRGPIREVLNRLTQQGLLISEANKGVRVASQPSVTLRPLLVDLRKTIEFSVLEKIFDQISKKDIASWSVILADIKEACLAGDSAALVEHDLKFHKAILQSHDEDEVSLLWTPIAFRMLIHYERLGDLMESHREHKAILDAIKKGNKKAALEALEKNIQ